MDVQPPFASIAGLVLGSARVFVGPPLLVWVSVAGSWFCLSWPARKGHVVPWSTLPPALVKPIAPVARHSSVSESSKIVPRMTNEPVPAAPW